MDDEPRPMGNTTFDPVMTGAGPGTDVNAAVTDTDTDEDAIAYQEIVTPLPAVIEDERGTQNVINGAPGNSVLVGVCIGDRI